MTKNPMSEKKMKKYFEKMRKETLQKIKKDIIKAYIQYDWSVKGDPKMPDKSVKEAIQNYAEREIMHIPTCDKLKAR